VEKNMSVKFSATQAIMLPASGAAAASTPFVLPSTAWDVGKYMGIEMPTYVPPSSSPLTLGCDPNSGFHLSRYRISFLGAKELRPANQPGLYNGIQFALDGRSRSLALISNGVSVPFVSSDWEDLDMMFQIVSTQTQVTTPRMLDVTTLYIDTRNLQSVYYGSQVRVLFELEGECVLNF
jgi:hypothetical protein